MGMCHGFNPLNFIFLSQHLSDLQCHVGNNTDILDSTFHHILIIIITNMITMITIIQRKENTFQK